MELLEIESLVVNTIKEYYAMTEDQRNFILDLIDKSEKSWTRHQLMKALLLFNKAKELNCNIHDNQLDKYVDGIDKNGRQFDLLFVQHDNTYRESQGVSNF